MSRFTPSLICLPLHPNSHRHTVAGRFALWVVVADGKSKVKQDWLCVRQNDLPVNEDRPRTFAPGWMDGNGFLHPTPVNSLQSCVSARCLIRAPPTHRHRLHWLAENLEGDLVVALLPQGDATSLSQSHDFLLRGFRFSGRSHFHNQNRMSPFHAPCPLPLAPLRKRMDGIVGVVSSFTGDGSKLQNPLTFRRQLKTLRVGTYDAPSVNDL
ncbi:MAG: hypothetical protein LKKZDAJK_002359 [Candidatus Fervidibacter sp.]